MNAVVVESYYGKTVILTDSGEFIDISGNYEIGQVIEYNERKEQKLSLSEGTKRSGIAARRNALKVAAAAACLILTLSVGIYTFDVQQAYATVSLGEGISVEYKLDRDGNVIEINATDESGEELAAELEDIGVKGKGIEEALTDARKVIEKKNSENGSAQGAGANELKIAPEINCRNEDQKEALEKRVENAEPNDIEDTAAKNDKTEEKTDLATTPEVQENPSDGEPSVNQDFHNESPVPEDSNDIQPEPGQPEGTKGQPEGTAPGASGDSGDSQPGPGQPEGTKGQPIGGTPESGESGQHGFAGSPQGPGGN